MERSKTLTIISLFSLLADISGKLSIDIEQDSPNILKWGWRFILPATRAGCDWWQYSKLHCTVHWKECFFSPFSIRFVCEVAMDLQVCKFTILECFFNRCLVFFPWCKSRIFLLISYAFFFFPTVWHPRFVPTKSSLHPTQALWMYTGFPPNFYVPKKAPKIGQPSLDRTMSRRTEGQLSSEKKTSSLFWIHTYTYCTSYIGDYEIDSTTFNSRDYNKPLQGCLSSKQYDGMGYVVFSQWRICWIDPDGFSKIRLMEKNQPLGVWQWVGVVDLSTPGVFVYFLFFSPQDEFALEDLKKSFREKPAKSSCV